MSKSFPCKEKGCTESVTYDRQTATGMKQIPDSKITKSKTVYLTCKNGHTHSYEVSG